jgi:hypothetical protein
MHFYQKYVLDNINLYQLINIIFTNPPKPANSIIIDIKKIASDQNLTVFQSLMTILLNGAKILFGENISAENISESQHDTLQKYIKSIGYELHHEYKYNEHGIPLMVNVYFLPYIGNDNCSGIQMGS